MMIKALLFIELRFGRILGTHQEKEGHLDKDHRESLYGNDPASIADQQLSGAMIP